MNRPNRTAFCLVVIAAAAAYGEEKPLNPRQVTEKYLSAVQAGKADDAAALAAPGSTEGSKKRIGEYKELFGSDPIKLSRVLAGKKDQALAISEAVRIKSAKANEPDTGYLLIKLSKIQDQWRVKDVDFKSAEAVKKAIDAFKDKNGDVEELP